MRCLIPLATMVLMPQPIKPTPEKFCKQCGIRLERKRWASGVLESLLHFSRRLFCDRACMARDFDLRPTKPDPNWSTAHYHARRAMPLGPCARCGKQDAKDVHHKNGNWRDNSEGNLERVCRSCHNQEHRARGLCVLCKKPVKGFGYCTKHYQRFKTWGDPMVVKRNQHTPAMRSGD